MRPFICFMMLSLLVVGGIADTTAAPPEDVAITIRVTPQMDINQDSIGFAIHPEGVGLISPGKAHVILYKIPDSGDVIAVVGNIADEDSDLPKGLIVSGDGNTMILTSDKVFIFRKELSSHQEADSILESGEEYFLKGDRVVYRRP